MKCFLPSNWDQAHLSAQAVGSMERERLLLSSVYTACFSDKQIVLPSFQNCVSLKVPDAHLVGRSHVKLRMMLFAPFNSFLFVFLTNCFSNFPKFVSANCLV